MLKGAGLLTITHHLQGRWQVLGFQVSLGLTISE